MLKGKGSRLTSPVQNEKPDGAKETGTPNFNIINEKQIEASTEKGLSVRQSNQVTPVNHKSNKSSVCGINDMTTADEQLRNLAEALDNHATNYGLNGAADLTSSMMHNDRNLAEWQENRDGNLPSFRASL